MTATTHPTRSALRAAGGIAAVLAALGAGPVRLPVARAAEPARPSEPARASEPAKAAGPAKAAQPTWNDEFSDICSKTQDAMALTDGELRSLVERCDELRSRLDQLTPPERKVYARRLAACRDLFQYVLDSRGSKDAG